MTRRYRWTNEGPREYARILETGAGEDGEGLVLRDEVDGKIYRDVHRTAVIRVRG